MCYCGLKRKDDEEMMILPFSKICFLASFRHQQYFPFRQSLIDYISKNPKISLKVYQKLIQTCKYFFIKNPILVVSHFFCRLDENKWKTYFNDKFINFEKLDSAKIWITDQFTVINNEDGNINEYFAQFILPKIYQSCNFNELYILKQTFFFDDFLGLSSKCSKITLVKGTVINRDNSAVTLEKLVESIPNVLEFSISPGDSVSKNVITPKTVEKLLKIPHFANLKSLHLVEIPETFDMQIFYDYIKRNKTTSICLLFEESISAEYKNRLQNIVDEILVTEDHKFKIPYIHFPGNDETSFIFLSGLFESHLFL